MEEKELIIIGGSAGSIDVLFSILPQLPSAFPVPIIVVIHRSQSIESSLEETLQQRCKIKCTEIYDKMKLEKGMVHIAPAGYHLLMETDILVT